MNQENDEFKIEEENPIPEEQPEAASIPETLETEEIPEPVGTPGVVEKPKIKEPPPEKPEKPEKSEPSKFKNFLNKALIWLAVIVIAFGAGFLLDHFLRYQPLQEDLRQAQADQALLQEDLDEIQNQIGQITPKLEAANARVSSLEEELKMANARLEFYQVLVDVNNAQLKLFLEDTEAAETALADTQLSLEKLGPVIEEIDPELAVSLPSRLELITAGLARDPETARIDLELFTKDLLALEPLLFEE
ncbi:MAG: hypothetical protein SVP52_00940 [Chloroflexota bacterium]|nr:hypothetical protein [Chloroflexota bacterium]